MDSSLSPKLVSLFFVFSVCLLGYVSMSTWSIPTPTSGKVAISDQTLIKQGANVSYYFASDAYLDKLEVASTYIELDDKLKIATLTTNPVNVTIGSRSLASAHSSWVLSCNASTSMTFTLSGLQSGLQYYIKVDGIRVSQLRAISGGSVSFTYSGSWSSHSFSVDSAGWLPASVHPYLTLILFSLALSIAMPVIGFALKAKDHGISRKDVIELATYVVICLAMMGFLVRFFAWS